MLNTFMQWLDTDPGVCATFGVMTYAVFITWKKGSARWTNWFPVLQLAAKWTLYACAFVVLVFGFRALGQNLLSPTGAWAIAGATVLPILGLLKDMIRPSEKVRRGARIGMPADVNRLARKNKPASDFKENVNLGGVDIPLSDEQYHLFVIGSTGSGKSVAITGLLDKLESRGDLVLVVDSGGEYCSRYYRAERDHVLNPFDDRCTPWSPTAEMAGPWDAEALAKSMIPDGVGESKEWNGYAQTLVTSVLRRLHDRGQLSIKDLLYYVQSAPVEELGPLLAGTPAAAQLVSEKTFGSIRTIAANYLATYAYLEDNAKPFSISKFIKAEKPGFLFMTYRDDQLDSLRNMIACALDIAARTILAMSANPHRRVWLIIDEFASIGKVQSIEAVATKARKMGGCLLIGLQSVSQLQDRYGDKAAQTILSCLSSWLVLRCSDADTAEYISKYIGDTEISRMTRGESSSDSGGSDSLNEQIQTQRAVMPIEIQRLANLKGFFKLAGDYPICNVKLKFPDKRSKRTDNYAERDFDAKPMLDLLDRQDAPSAADLVKTAAPAFDASPTTLPAEAPQEKRVSAESVVEQKPRVLKLRQRSRLLIGPSDLAAVLKETAEAHNAHR